ncbi:ABC transporter permease [Butyrivibrio sp. YAB3001]|uniref:ABC transporter permease n=1 Tax=Butyrivibrio sp. YAB3001 TaxID=1520812 RepID=UPI0008F68129|nr:FtsX-like permease family protein [Butyrivibrio sp. YAB3001]SFC13007.1 FtsX-like permease family protein [Butyrivibrio sp. YAB3001]
MKKMLFRKIKKRKIQSIGIIAITLLWMFVVAFSLNLYSTNNAFKKDYFEATNVEDFNFVPTDFSALDDLADKYQFKYEAQYTRDFEENGLTYRLISKTEDIDVPYVTEGKLSDDADQVIVNPEYAEKSSVLVGNTLKIQGKEYTVTAIANLVNYVKMHVSDSNYNYDPKNQLLVIMDKDELLSLEEGELGVRYLAKFSGISEETKSDVLAEILRSDEFITVTGQADNSSITALDGKISVYFLLTVISLCVLSVIIVILLIMFVYILISEDRKQIGILKANGMKSLTIWNSYLLMILSLMLPSGIAGFIAGSFAAPYFDEILGRDISLPVLDFEIHPEFVGMISGIILWIALLSTVLATVGILNKTVTELLKNNKIKNVSKFEKFVKKVVRPKNVVRRMKVSFAVRSKLLLILVLFSVFAAGVQFLLSYTIYNMNNKMISVQTESMNFENQVYFSEKVKDTEEGNQYFARVEGVSTADNTSVQIYALTEGDKIDYGKDGIKPGNVILNQTAAEILKVKEGDQLKLAIGEKEVEFTVEYVCNRIVGKEVFADYQSLVDEEIIEEGFSGMYTDKKDIAVEGNIVNVMSKQEIIDNYKQSEDVIKAASVIMAVLGVMIPVILITITVSVLISQNKREITILKANGVGERSMNRMIYGAYNIFLVLGIAISIPYSFMIMQIIFSIAVKASGIKYPAEIDPKGILVSVCMTTIIYYGTMFILKHKKKLGVEEARYDFS